MAKLLLGATPEHRSYTDFEPRSQWIDAEETDTLLVDLSGFNKDQLKVVISSSGSFKISGERPADGSGDRWLRFLKYFTIPKHCNPKGIQAKFDKEEGLLYVILPKLAASQSSQRHAASQGAPARTRKPGAAPGTTSATIDAANAAPPRQEDEEQLYYSAAEGGDMASGRPGSGTAARQSSSRQGRTAGAAMGVGKRKLLLVNVVAGVMVLVGIGVYLGFKLRGLGGEGSS